MYGQVHVDMINLRDTHVHLKFGKKSRDQISSKSALHFDVLWLLIVCVCRFAFATLSFIAETFIFLYVGMDALDYEKWKMSTLR